MKLIFKNDNNKLILLIHSFLIDLFLYTCVNHPKLGIGRPESRILTKMHDLFGLHMPTTRRLESRSSQPGAILRRNGEGTESRDSSSMEDHPRSFFLSRWHKWDLPRSAHRHDVDAVGKPSGFPRTGALSISVGRLALTCRICSIWHSRVLALSYASTGQKVRFKSSLLSYAFWPSTVRLHHFSACREKILE